MEREAEDPTRDFLPEILYSLVLGPSELGESVTGYDVFVTGWFLIPQIGPPFIPVWIEYTFDCAKGVGKWEAAGVGPGVENRHVTTPDIFKDTGRWVHDREVRKGEEEAGSGHRREWLQPLRNHCSSVNDFHTANEDVETICNEGGV